VPYFYTDQYDLRTGYCGYVESAFRSPEMVLSG